MTLLSPSNPAGLRASTVRWWRRGRRPLVSRGVVAAVLLGLVSAAPAMALEDSETEGPLVVSVRADWCGTCRRLEPVLAQLRQRVGDGARFVVLDTTDETAVARSLEAARRNGLEDFFKVAQRKTGLVAIFGEELGAPYAVLKGETDVTAYEAAIERARRGQRARSPRW